MDILTVRGLKKSFRDKRVLCGLDLSVPEHSVFGFIGKNGAGKTTTMKAILGLFPVDAGEITVCGERVCYGETETNRHVGYLPDVPEFYGFMTSREYLALCGECLGMERSAIRSRTDELLTLVGLANETHRIKGFSRGMKQRLGIAQALFGRPKLLICDEPTSALDPIGRKEILDILSAAKTQTTVLFSTHILSDVERICTDAAFLKDGRIVLGGKITELKGLCSTEEFTVAFRDPHDAARFASVFPQAKRQSEDTLVVTGDATTMHAVLQYLAQAPTSLCRLERNEASLESLFLEVASS
ncbi:MAG: ABC transporter ATP-binding protein [Clostridia bacterium]|nr:ABC transporter ATP-binding protein [Clostridia bacterium]